MNAVEKIFVSRKSWCSGAAVRCTRLRRGVAGVLGLLRGELVEVFSPAAVARGVGEGCEKARCEEEDEVATPLPYL